jgi:hypothetical protein
MGIRDQLLMFSDAQVLTATALSTNVIDLGPLSGSPAANLIRDIGAGEVMWLVVSSPTILDSAAEGSTLAITLETDDNAAFSSGTVVLTSGALAESTVVGLAGWRFVARLPTFAYERYLAVRYTVAVENFTSGTISATLQRDIRIYRDYRGGSVSNAE